jgi:hypothetical protein|tara:strand:+ start:2968 stop:3903 length:936 start_codon:yes stop_codon:yes gene_type:complete
MKKIVINLCGVKSKGGITVINNYISQNKSNTLYVLYDNSDLDKYIKNFDSKFIDTKRIYHLFLNFFLDKQTLEKINSYDYIIHFGNFGFKTTIKSYTLIQNILPLVKPLSSLRNFTLNLAYKYTFKITDEIIVQQKHVADTIPNQYKTKIIGSFEIKNIKQTENIGFVTIYEEIKNKNPKFQKELLREIASKFDEKITVINLSTNNEIYENNFNVLEDLDRNELMQVFKSHSTYIHTSEFETVGLPIYEALELGLKVVVPNLEYINLENENIFKYEFGNYSSAINAIDESIKNLKKVYCDVPIYYENWNLG